MGKYRKNGSPVLPLVDPLDRLLDHQRLILDRFDVGDDAILFDDRADVAGVREAAEVIEADAFGPSVIFAPERHLLLGARLAVHPVHAEVPLADAGRV